MINLDSYIKQCLYWLECYPIEFNDEHQIPVNWVDYFLEGLDPKIAAERYVKEAILKD